MSVGVTWPDDVDGDVFRRLAENEFDFSTPHEIDFNVDFENWPPVAPAVALLRARFPTTEVIDPGDGDRGFVEFKVFDLVAYELVMRIQAEVSRLMAPFGGRCDSWGILSDGPKAS
ncbi:MAG: ribonuclease E inhibitor RraB [Rhizomicrobium sp.]